MIYVKSIGEFVKMVDSFNHKSTLTNNFILLDDYQQYVDEKRLTVISGEKNLFMLLKKNGFSQLYYYINDLAEPASISIDEPVVMEILYRGEKYMPTEVIEYWKRNGFQQHLGRDLMATAINKVSFSESLNDKITVTYARNVEGVEYSFNIIKDTFDAYTGDILSIDEVKQYALNDEIFLATIGGEPCGILQMDFKNNVSWLGHIAVDSKFRKQGIANALVNAWIRKTAEQPNARYQLWVIQDNTPALTLYKKYGFAYAGKSTISMIKK